MTWSAWFDGTPVVVRTPAAIVAYPEFSLQLAEAVTSLLVPSLNEAVATYFAVEPSVTVAGPVTATELSVADDEQEEGASSTVRWSVAEP